MYRIKIMKMRTPTPIWIDLASVTLEEAQRCCRNEEKEPDTIGYKIEDDAGKVVEKWGSV